MQSGIHAQHTDNADAARDDHLVWRRFAKQKYVARCPDRQTAVAAPSVVQITLVCTALDVLVDADAVEVMLLQFFEQ